jgi:ribosomal protein L11 methyltransferase
VAALIRLDVAVPRDLEPLVTAFLFERVSYGWEEVDMDSGDLLMRVHIEQPEFSQALEQELGARWPLIRVERSVVPNRDWALAWREFFTAVPCGEDFLVVAPWMEELLQDAPRQGRVPIVIEPKTAFGTGHHPTTALCLEVVSVLFRQGRIRPGMRFLDLGTGSGILGVGCSLLGLTGVGLDIDPLAIDNALENRSVNRVEEFFEVAVGDLDAAAGERFDLILANILAEPLVELAPRLCASLKPGGVLVLSGLLEIQRRLVAEAYLAQGMPEPEELVRGEWAALVFAVRKG